MRISLFGGRFGVKNKKKGGFNRISRMRTAGGENIGYGNRLWIFGFCDSPMICLQQKESRIEHFEKPQA